MKLKINIVDAFTDTRFKGNSAAVIVVDRWLEDGLMQAIAMENNLSETAFLVKAEDGSYTIRWFSPLKEVPFCGHATLASAFVLFSGQPDLDCIVMTSEAVGRMIITRNEDGSIQMDFPNRRPTPVETVPPDLLRGLSIRPVRVMRNSQAYFVVYADEEDVRNVVQDKECLKRLAPYDVVVTARSREYDFVSRYFWPASGGEEDPVTGSIHAGLAPYWAEELGRSSLSAFQASRRGGVLRCKVEGERVFVSGEAVQYLEGFIDV